MACKRPNSPLDKGPSALASKGIDNSATMLQPPVAPFGVPAALGLVDAAGWRHWESRRAQWQDLADRAAEPNPFLEPWYALPALAAFDPGEAVQFVAVNDGEKLLGLMPIARQPRYYTMTLPNVANWMHANAFVGTPLVAKGSEACFWRSLLAWLDMSARRSLFLHLHSIPLEGPVYAALRAVLKEQDRNWQCVHREERAMLASTLDPEAYWEAALSGKKRKELRRQLRRLGEEGKVQFERLTGDDGLHAWLDDFLFLEAAGWKGANGSALACSAQTEGLFRESLKGAAACGKLERLTLRFDGRPVAMLATFLAPPGAFSFKTAFDETFARFSPGVLLQQENLKSLPRGDIAWTDSCASADHPMIDHIWRERRAIGRFSIAIGGPARRFVFQQIARFETGHDPDGASR